MHRAHLCPIRSNQRYQNTNLSTQMINLKRISTTTTTITTTSHSFRLIHSLKKYRNTSLNNKPKSILHKNRHSILPNNKSGLDHSNRINYNHPPQNLLTLRHIPPQLTLVNSSLSASAPSLSSYAQLGLLDTVVAAIEKVISSSFPNGHTKVIKPTEIQSLAALNLLNVPSSNNVRALILAAETGSGKTLAYLGPMMHILLKQESEFAIKYEKYTEELDSVQSQIASVSTSPNSNDEPIEITTTNKAPIKPIPLRRQGYPRAVILVPSHELMQQVSHIAKQVSHTARIRVASATTNTPSHHLRRILNDPIDMFITTPGSLSAFISKHQLKLSDLNLLVIDEADFIVDQGFAQETEAVIDQLHRVVATRRPDVFPTVMFVSATVPKSLYTWVQSKFPSFSTPQFVASNALHRPIAKCKQQFVDVARQFKSNQHAALLNVLQSSHDMQKGSTLIFVNQRKSIDPLHAYLSSQPQFSTKVLRLSKLQTTEERACAWDQFKSTPGTVLIATDVAARGLDSTHVDLVVNYDIPNSALEYLHRIGRCARAGRTGTAISLVTKRSRELVLALQQRLKGNTHFGMEKIG